MGGQPVPIGKGAGFSPEDEIGLVNVPSTLAVPQNAAVAHHSALLQRQAQRVVLSVRGRHAALSARTKDRRLYIVFAFILCEFS